MEQLVAGREGGRREKTLDRSARMHFMYKDLASHFYGACPTVPLGAVTVNYLIYCGKILNLPHFHRPGFQTLGFLPSHWIGQMPTLNKVKPLANLDGTGDCPL